MFNGSVLSLLIGFVMMGVVEVIFKPISMSLTKRTIKKYLPAVLESIDQRIVNIVLSFTPDMLENAIIEEFEKLMTEKEFSKIDNSVLISQFEKEYSPIKNLEKLNPHIQY